MGRTFAANFITASRILFSLLLFPFAVFSPAFWVFYLLGGFTDMIDGTVARKTNSVSSFGSKLDTAADFVFFLSVLWKLFPLLKLPLWQVVWIGVIAAVKILCVVFGFAHKKQFVVNHSVWNKITGTLLFILPLTLRYLAAVYSVPLLCVTASVCAVQECYWICTNRKRKE